MEPLGTGETSKGCDWQNGVEAALLQPSLFHDPDICLGSDLDWELAQLPSHYQALDELEWEDIAKINGIEENKANTSMERRTSQNSLWDGSSRSASDIKTRGVKRRRVQHKPLSAVVSTNTEVAYQARQNALQQISRCGWNAGCLVEMENFVCEDKHCFAMESMGKDPRGYSGEPIRREIFEVRIIEPPTLSQRLNMKNYPPQSLAIPRQIGRSLHLIMTKYPRMARHELLESGFSLLIVCIKAESSQQWSPLCLASFIGTPQTKKSGSDNIHFVANLDRCTKAENGKRLWGERTSHVKHEQRPAKPLRLEPRGSAQSFENGSRYCIIVTLHDSQGKLLSDVDNVPCIAQSNAFYFETQEHQLANQFRSLLDQFEKLSISQKTMLTTSSSSVNTRKMLLSNSYDTQRAAGVFISSAQYKLPPTACALAEYNKDSNLPITQAYSNRVQAVAAFLGRQHANPELTDQYVRYLRTLNAEGAEGRYLNLYFDGQIGRHLDWLQKNGITMKITDVYNRAQILHSILYTREYRSNWVICVGNVYPPDIMVDREDSSMVHCLCERAGQDTLDLCDRLYPLARFAYCSRIPRSRIKELLFIPYIQAFQEAGGNKIEEETLNEEKFWLILQGIFLEYFLYWTELRNAQSCARIQQRLLEDDQLLDDKFFGPDKMHKFPVE